MTNETHTPKSTLFQELESKPSIPDPDEDHFLSYLAFSNRLRIWLSTYGVAALGLVVSQDNIVSIMTPSEAILIASAFIFGSGMQLIFVAVHKWAEWAKSIRQPNSKGEYGYPEKSKKDRLYKFALWLGKEYYFDFIVDFGAIIVYTVATFKVIIIAASA